MKAKSRAMLVMIQTRQEYFEAAVFAWDLEPTMKNWYLLVAAVRELRMALYDCERELTIDSVDATDWEEGLEKDTK